MEKNKKQCDQHLWVRLSLGKGKGSDYHSSTQHLCAAGLRVLYQQLNELEHPSALIKYYTSHLQCTRPEQGEGKKNQQLHFGAKLGAYPSFTNKCRRIERQQLGQACSESRGEEGHPSPARLRAGFPCAPPEQALLEVLLV